MIDNQMYVYIKPHKNILIYYITCYQITHEYLVPYRRCTCLDMKNVLKIFHPLEIKYIYNI